MSAGIDYGSGKTNRDPENGIRYGVVALGSILQAWCDSSEPIYAEGDLETDDDKVNGLPFEDELVGFEFNAEGYEAQDCLDSDVMFTKSPYFAFCKFCSPCVPGAGDLNSPDPDGIRAYCPGPDWFEPPPEFPIYSVATGEKIYEPKTIEEG